MKALLTSASSMHSFSRALRAKEGRKLVYFVLRAKKRLNLATHRRRSCDPEYVLILHEWNRHRRHRPFCLGFVGRDVVSPHPH